MEQVVSFNQILDILKKRIKVIILFMFIGVAVAGGITFFFITPKFNSQAQLVVTLPQTENTNSNDVNSNLQMINTYKDFIISDLVLNQVENRLKSDYNIKINTAAIKNSIIVQQNQNSQMFSIIAKSSNANNAMYIANTVATIFQENAKDVLNVDRITIISKAVVNTKPISPNNKVNILIGLILGTILGTVFALLLDLFDRTVKDTSFIVEELGFTVIGTVPEISDKEVAKYIKEAKKISQFSQENTTEGKIKNEVETRRKRNRV